MRSADTIRSIQEENKMIEMLERELSSVNEALAYMYASDYIDLALEKKLKKKRRLLEKTIKKFKRLEKNS